VDPQQLRTARKISVDQLRKASRKPLLNVGFPPIADIHQWRDGGLMSGNREATAPIPNGIVFLHDPTMVVDIPPDTSAAPVLATSDCVSLWTVHEIDGSATLVFAEADEGDDCALLFQGTLPTEGGKLAFTNSAGETIVEIELEAKRVDVAIYADDTNEPSKLVCTASPV
jgi:hypothetical protein